MSRTHLRIKQLIWLFFFLLIFEGVLRKWIMPSLAGPLLLIRDPIVIAIYGLALSIRRFPQNSFLWVTGFVALFTLGASFINQDSVLSVSLFGFRTDFLYLPLVFVIPQFFDESDVKRMGYWVLVLAVPLALLMVIQFRSPSTAWINAGAGEGAKQIDLAEGRIRAAATFSYIFGPIFFFALVAAFLLHSQVSSKQYPLWLIGSSTVALIIASVVSGSRSLVVSVAIVAVMPFVIGMMVQPRLILKWAQVAVLMGAAVFVASQFSVFSEGVGIFSTRINNASLREGGGVGFAARIAYAFVNPVRVWSEVPFFGYGLGMGTNVGSVLLTGRQQFLLAEDEWSRVLFESGPLFGAAFIGLRIWLLLTLLWRSIQQARHGHMLPLLLWGACGPIILSGQLGQTTALGFGTFVAGLCLASMRPQLVPIPTKKLTARRAKMQRGRQPVYAAPMGHRLQR